MKRYNIWNIIFHNSEVNKNIEDYKFQQSLVDDSAVSVPSVAV